MWQQVYALCDICKNETDRYFKRARQMIHTAYTMSAEEECVCVYVWVRVSMCTLSLPGPAGQPPDNLQSG